MPRKADKEIPRLLLDWYRTNKRDLPWRRTKDPYRVWISEVMLQQTTVGAVVPYYKAWMARFPNVGALARAPLQGVLKAWQGLGYYQRARNLHGAARAIDPSSQDVEKEMRTVRPIGADVVFEVAGNSTAQAACIPLARKGGTVMFFGVSPQDRLIQVNPFVINENELRVLGSFNNQFATARAVQLLASGAVRVKALVSHRLGLKDYLDVFRLFGGRDTMKLMVTV